MSGFRLYLDRVPGVCDGCASVVVQRTQTQQVRVLCNYFSGVPKPVKEPLERCSLRQAREASMSELPEWMLQQAWIPVQDDGVRTFIIPQEMTENPDAYGTKRVAGFVIRQGGKIVKDE